MFKLNLVWARLVLAIVHVLGVLGLTWYIQHLQTSNKDLEIQNNLLTQKIEMQNAAVDQMRKDAEARENRFADQIKNAAEAADRAASAASKYYKAKPSSADDCRASLDLMNAGGTQ